MNWTYLIIDIGTFLCAFFLSFDKKIKYRTSWLSAILASIVVAIPFLIWDYFFTENNFWGFNPDYIIGLSVYNLPLEEILFFILIPFSCTFIYEVTKYFFKNWNLISFNKYFFYLIPLYAIFLILLGDYGYYTISVIISSFIALRWLRFNPSYSFAPLAFVISIIPFLIVNGVLTGGFTEEPIVWYEESQKISQRIFTIPMEDVLYSFTLIIANIIVFEKLQLQLNR